MKKLILLLFICPIVSFSQSFYSNSYKEINVGLYVIPQYFVYPGASFLWGKTKYYNNNTLLDYQIGIAFPTVVTGKVGYGTGDQDYATIFGIRPFPTSAYVQFSFDEKNNIGLEYEPFNYTDGDGLGLIICYGYRF